MPAGRNPFLRYKIINACITNKKKPYPTIDDFKTALAKHDITVGQRAIENDLEAMRYDKSLGYHAPIAYSKKFKGYHYTDPDYTIDKLPLTEDELEAFELIVESFKRFRGAEVLNQVEGMFDKLDKVVMQQVKPKKSSIDYPVVDFEKMPYSKGIEHFDKLYQAIIKQQPIVIAYKKFDELTVNEHVFHPYLLKEYKFRWYVLGYSERRRGKLILALDRIENITNKKIPFKPYKGIDVQKYFDHTIGVTINTTGVKEIRLWVSPSQSNYLKTQHLHATQQIISDDNSGMILSLQLIPNYELLQTLLAYGPEVKVLEPSSLKEQMKEMVSKTMRLYQ
ncbi:WYL domain-containing protein [Chryseolinea sp. H1M3-3]|uniref:helix-turn-helix transcriptional regulator n=1 Tax=Chryseolinea sp. H1M3-3 TaxID=3034144 RepID=UPI0023EC45C6|nr:WYL domain-containing protein [Chryseolinea sp. H1M3-3]